MGNRIWILLTTLTLSQTAFFGCRARETHRPIWEQAKIGELAVIEPEQDRPPKHAGLIQLEVLAYEIPAENIALLQEMWKPLTSKGLRFKNHTTFRANGFRVGKGSSPNLSWVLGKLGQAQGRRVDTIALTFADDQENDIPMRPVSTPRTLTFRAMDGTAQSVTVAAGVFCWRLEAKKIEPSGLISQFTAYPFFKVPVVNTIEELAERAKARQIAFLAAAFTTRLTVGDLVILGPEHYYGDRSTLGGLLLENPRGRLFFPEDPQGTAGVKPTLTILVIRCLDIQ